MKSKEAKTVEGLRERKRRQTRERLINAALSLFVKQGFDAVTVEEIAAAADTTKRIFFDYFSSKEDVIVAWQDDFGVALAEAVRQRPAEETLAVVVERAFTDSISTAATPRSIAIDRLVKSTPALRIRDQLKYARLEQMLADALLERVKDRHGQFRVRMLAVIIIGALRIATDKPVGQQKNNNKEMVAYAKQIFQVLWSDLREFGQSAPSAEK